MCILHFFFFFFFQAEDGIRDYKVTGVQTCALPISSAVVNSASEIPPATAAIPADSAFFMPRKALMMPNTVPNKPTKGAVDPIVARPDKPRRNSAVLIAIARWRARFEASISSPEISDEPS